MERYFEITKEKLAALHDGIEMMELLNRDAMQDFDLCLYGITTQAQIIDAAKEAIADAAEFDIREEDVQLSEVAIAIPLGADTIYALEGNGFRLKNQSFAYQGKQGEGIRTLSFAFASYRPNIAANYFTQMALASSDSWLDDFLKQYGSKQPVQIEQKVRRTEEATQPGVPAPATPPPAVKTTQPEIPPTPGVPKQTSLKISDLLEKFLG